MDEGSHLNYNASLYARVAFLRLGALTGTFPSSHAVEIGQLTVRRLKLECELADALSLARRPQPLLVRLPPLLSVL